MKKIQRAILDFDNTIANWTAYAVPAYFNMAQALSDATGIELSTIIEEMKTVYHNHQTIEYAPLVQEMPILSGRADLDQLVSIAKSAFSKVKRQHLKLYPGIKDLLEDLRKHEIKIYILTDAPFIQAAKRAERLKISHLIDGLIGLESPPAEKIHPLYRKAKLEFPFKTVVSDIEKPYTDLPKVMTEITGQPITKEELKGTTIFIGDNPVKDGLLIKIWGLFGYLAEYGKSDEEILKQLLHFIPESLSHRSNFDPKETESTIQIDENHQIVLADSVQKIHSDLKEKNFTL